MTNQEFTVFADRLFIAFPSLFEWLKATYKPEETQRVWRTTLAPFTLGECLSVVDRWISGALEPFPTYDRDKVHLIVRSICSADRDRERKKLERVTMASPYRDKRGWQGERMELTASFDSAMKAAVVEGAIEHKRYMVGEITLREYNQLRKVILEKHGITKKGADDDALGVFRGD